MAPIPLNKTNMSSFEQLKSCDKLVKVLASRNQQCQTCKKSEFVDHVHFIIDEGCTLNPVEGIPELVDITCAQCGQKAVQTFKVCGKCKSAFYCNKSCQKSHWSLHSKECGSPKESAAIKAPHTQSVNGNVCNGGISLQSSVHVPTPLAAPAKSANAQKPKEGLRSQGDLVPIGVGDEVDRVAQKKAVTKEVSKTPPLSKFVKQKIEKSKLQNDDVLPFLLTFGSNPDNFYIQRAADSEKAAFITECLNTECPKVKSWDGVASLEIGDYCACLYEEDGNWYRAKLLQKVGEKFHIIFVDFGNPDTVSAGNLRALPPQMTETPALAVHCKLYDVRPKGDDWSEDSIKEFAKQVESGRFTECKVHGCNQDGVYSVNLLDKNGKSVNNELIIAGLAIKLSIPSEAAVVDTPKTSTPKPVEIIRQPKATPPVTKPEQKIESKVESTSSPSTVASAGIVKKTSLANLRNLKSLRKPENIKLRCVVDDLEVSNKSITAILMSVFDVKKLQLCAIFNVEDFCDIVNELQAVFTQEATPCSDIEVGKFVAVKYDDEWQRAYVVKVNEDGTCFCLSLDIGILAKYEEVYPLPQKFLEKPSMLGLISPIGESSEKVFRDLNVEEPVSISVYIAQKGDEIIGRIKFEASPAECNVVLKSYQSALKEITESLNKKNPLDKLPVSILNGGKQAALVVYQSDEDKGVFFVVSDTDKMAILMEEMGNLQRLGQPIASPEVGTYCIAKSEDEEWYRAVVIESMPDKSKVYFMDFGNEDLVPNKCLLSITDDFSPDKIPAQGVKCVLAEKYRNDKVYQSVEQAVEGGGIFHFEVLSKEGDHYIVSV